MKELKYNKMLWGLLPGLLLPVLSLLLVWVFSSDLPLGNYLARLQLLQIFPKVLSLCTLPNLLLFFISIWTHRYFTARGVILATLLVAFIMLIFKFA